MNKLLLKDVFWRAIQVVSKQGILFVIFILASHILPKNDFGILSYLLAIVSTLVIFADFGLSTAASKFVAQYRSTDTQKLNAVIASVGAVFLVLAVVVALLSMIFASIFHTTYGAYLYYLLPLVFLIPLSSLLDGVYRGLGKFKSLALISICAGTLSLVAAYPLVEKYGIVGGLISQIIFYSLFLLSALVLHKPEYFLFNRSVMKEISSYGFLYGIAVVGYFMFSKTDVIILGHFGYYKEVASYELINKVLLGLTMPFAILGQVLAPRFAVLSAQNKNDIIYYRFIKYSLVFLLLSIPVGALSYWGLRLLLPLWGGEYGDAATLRILLMATITFTFNIAAATVDSGVIVSTGYAGLMSVFYLVIGLLNLFLALISIRFYGYMGPIYSTVLSTGIMVVGLRLLFYKKIKALSTVVAGS